MLKYRQMVDLLERRISNGEYPGGTLPAVRLLAEDLGVSYLTARKAVKELKENGIISHNTSNRKIMIEETVTKHPLVGVITPFWRFSEWMRSIRNVTTELGGQVRFVAYASDTDPVITEMLSGNFDVIFVELPTTRKADRLLDRLRKLGDRVVVLFHDMTRYGLRSFVGSSPEHLREIMEKLLHHGCRRIDALGPENSADLECLDRIRVWRSFLNRHHLKGEFHDPEVLPFEHPEPKVRQLVLDLIDSGRMPDAIFCLTPTLAIGLYRACYERGIRIGHDLSVFSFGEQETAKFMTPALATIANTGKLDPVMRTLLSQYLPGRKTNDQLLFQLTEFEFFEGESLVGQVQKQRMSDGSVGK